jgi:hypothetical protein
MSGYGRLGIGTARVLVNNRRAEQMSDEQRAREYPIETDGLSKGSIVDSATIEQAFGVKVGTDAYRFAIMECQAYVERRLAERGLVVVTRQEKNDVRICTDPEASKYKDREVRRSVRKMARDVREMSTVDRSKLTDDEREEHDRRLEINGRTVAAIRHVRKPQALPSKRATPLPPAQED